MNSQETEGQPAELTPDDHDVNDEHGEPASTSLQTLRHELHTPLNHIIGYSEMLLEELEDSSPADLVPDLQRIHVAGKHLLDLINEQLDPEKLAYHHTDVSVMCDELRILVNQVIEYSKLLQVEAARLGQDDFIPDLQKIHSAARSLLALIGASLAPFAPSTGTIDRESGNLSGSRARQDMERASGLHVEKYLRGAPVGHGSLLVVDDNEGTRDMLSRRLERQGYAVALAENGRRALEMLQAQEFDLVLLDIMMPELDGFAVLEHLKGDTTLCHVMLDYSIMQSNSILFWFRLPLPLPYLNIPIQR